MARNTAACPVGRGSVQRSRISGCVPRVLQKIAPEYSESARKARLTGTFVVRCVAGADGLPRDLHVVSSLGFGLDEKAIAAVSAAVQLRLCHPRVTGGRAKACPPLGSILLGMVRYTVLLSALLSLPTLPAQVITATLLGTAGPSIARRFLLSGFLLLPVLSWGQQQPIFFVQMSDPQFGMYTDNQDFAQETANFEFAIANINRLRPAFVVVTGDLVNKPADAQQLAEYKRIAGKLDSTIPL
jgi:hypothetical protein